MALLPGLDFATTAFAVRYCARPTPQHVDVHVHTEDLPGGLYAPWAMAAIVDAANFGAAGGDVFHPSTTAIEVVSGPVTEEEAVPMGTHYAWQLRVTAVAPSYIRNMVEELRRCGFNFPVAAMSIIGEGALDGSPMSVTEVAVRRWLDDPHAYPLAWPTPPFHISFTPRQGEDTEAWFRLELADRVTSATRASLEELAVLWLNAVRNYVSDEGELVLMDPNVTLPHCAHGGVEFRARYQDFMYNIHSRDLLVNMLTRFHSRVPIVAAEICG